MRCSFLPGLVTRGKNRHSYRVAFRDALFVLGTLQSDALYINDFSTKSNSFYFLSVWMNHIECAWFILNASMHLMNCYPSPCMLLHCKGRVLPLHSNAHPQLAWTGSVELNWDIYMSLYVHASVCTMHWTIILWYCFPQDPLFFKKHDVICQSLSHVLALCKENRVSSYFL